MDDVIKKVLNDRTILLFGRINKESAKEVISQLLYLNKTEGSIKLIVSSKGGCADSGFAIIDMIKSLSCDIETYCLGECESVADLIVASGTNGKRYCFPLSEMMIHSVWGDEISGNWESIQGQSDSIKRADRKAIDILMKGTSQNHSKIKRDLRTEHYMSAEEAIKYGIIDHIFEGKF